MRLFYVLVLVTLLVSLVAAEDVAVTVYNDDLGVISETRSLEFSKGINRLAFTDVPFCIDPASVRLEVLGGGNITILEQNYAYDLVGEGQMYEKYIDQVIDFVSADGEHYSGTLLAYDGGSWRTRGSVILRGQSGRIKIVQLDHIARVDFPELPEGFVTRPTLFWIYNSDTQGKLDAKVGYQTSGMNWSAEYVGVLDGEEKNLDLSGWASIQNVSGNTYQDATLKLVAGEIHRALEELFIRGGRGWVIKDGFDLEYYDELTFEEKAFFEYHLYTLPQKATLADREQKQIALFEPARSTVSKVFVYRPERNAKKVEVDIKFKNSKETGLGMPLPAGRARLFKADEDGSLILLGEDQIDHTPKDEEVKLQVGFAFDITAEEKLLDQTRPSPMVEDKVYEMKLSNRKEEAVSVEIEKKLYGYWDIMESSIAYEKKDATTIKFDVRLEADEMKMVKFKVQNYLRSSDTSTVSDR
ncbi:MAG: DUF4139 domain-containing protein [Candidatus Zixiibacteriota bacterium]|nr:MAG: DUF4139 domain-containing protein [candidate division Zixibacteria bacterium]